MWIPGNYGKHNWFHLLNRSCYRFGFSRQVAEHTVASFAQNLFIYLFPSQTYLGHILKLKDLKQGSHKVLFALYTFAKGSRNHQKKKRKKCGFLRTDAFLIWSLLAVIKTASTQKVSGSWDKPGSFLQASPFCTGVEGFLVHRHHCEITKCLWERSQRVR